MTMYSTYLKWKRSIDICGQRWFILYLETFMRLPWVYDVQMLQDALRSIKVAHATNKSSHIFVHIYMAFQVLLEWRCVFLCILSSGDIFGCTMSIWCPNVMEHALKGTKAPIYEKLALQSWSVVWGHLRTLKIENVRN